MGLKVSVVEQLPSRCDTIVAGYIGGEDPPPFQPLLELHSRHEAQSRLGHIAQGYDGKQHWLLVGLGDRDQINHESLIAAAVAANARLVDLGCTSACWIVPDLPAAERALVEGTILAGYRYDERGRDIVFYDDGTGEKSTGPQSLKLLTASGDAERTARDVRVAQAVNSTRRLQQMPSNVLTPSALADHANVLAALNPRLKAERAGRSVLLERRMGAFAAVAQGSDAEPMLITLRYEPQSVPDDAPLLAFVGKGVTFDSGGLSIKPAASMPAMKSDMSGGAAVLEATAAIAALELPLPVVAVVGATENTIGPGALKPGDVVAAADGTTIEIDNTDAEGRLVLADCLFHARTALAADAIVDVATLTGAMRTALGTVHSGWFANDEQLAQQFQRSAAAAGEPVWRMPLGKGYAQLMRGKTADLTNAALGKGGGACSAAEFLHHFVGDTPWVHVDLGATAWDADVPYARKGGSGVMVRTLVALAELRAAAI